MLRSAGSVTINISGGGSLAYGSFYSSVDQSDGVNTPNAMACEFTAVNDGVTMEANGSGKKTRITFARAGTYNIQFSTQFHNTGGGGSGNTVDVWFRLNGNNIDNSNTKLTIPSNAPYVVGSWNFIQAVTAGQYVEIMWATDNANIILEQENATATYPAIPSVIITAIQIQ